MECNGMYCNVLGCNECMNICMYIHTYTKYVYMGIYGYTWVYTYLYARRSTIHWERLYSQEYVLYIYMWEYVLYISYIYSQNAVLHK
jgi:hypothetical protein